MRKMRTYEDERGSNLNSPCVPLAEIAPTNALQLTAYSLRSFVAPAFGSS
jgi:hypothetical protein